MISIASLLGLPKTIHVPPPTWCREFAIASIDWNWARLHIMGRPGFVEGTRELVEYPYVIVYKVFDERREILVLSILHGAQDRESGERQ